MTDSGISASRIDIWYAMSDLYLDTETDAGTLMVLADRLASTELSVEELDRIFYEEVHPVCCWNLTLVAGEWGAFDKAWLRKEISDNLNKQQPRGWLKRLRASQDLRGSKDLKEFVRCDWEKAKLLIELKRKGRLK